MKAADWWAPPKSMAGYNSTASALFGSGPSVPMTCSHTQLHSQSSSIHFVSLQRKAELRGEGAVVAVTCAPCAQANALWVHIPS